MTDPLWRPCSDHARSRDDPLAGTGSRGLHWLLVELSGPWGFSAFLDSPGTIDPQLGRALVRRAESAGMRVVAIRKPGRRQGAQRWRWAIADSRPGHESLMRGEVTNPQELLELPLDGSTGMPSMEPIVAVCTHGKHDRCCAVRGRYAAAAIAAHYPELTWECSHLGGDRFAATMILLPHGLYYGRVDSAVNPADLVALYLQGRVDDRFLRGRSSLPEAVQAAQHHARVHTGDDRLDGLVPLTVSANADEYVVVLGHEGHRVVVRLVEALSEPILSTCAARQPGRVRQFRLLDVHIEPA
ncbi:MAG: sucrase ferredoxin [Rhodococcus sp.]|nr:sucrase ferredoxin [Rhodococcus sp. (in: high G+C Gram-positive bacteria)]